MDYQTLNSDEKNRLVMIILDSIEESIEFDDFQETIGLLCEDIPGLDCWEIFQQTPLSLSRNR